MAEMGRRAGVKDHNCLRCGVPSAGFCCRDCYSVDRALVIEWTGDAKAESAKRKQWTTARDL